MNGPTSARVLQLRKWADVLLIAPLSANTLAKLSHGLADSLLTCVARAWDFKKPMIVAPAMNTAVRACLLLLCGTDPLSRHLPRVVL